MLGDFSRTSSWPKPLEAVSEQQQSFRGKSLHTFPYWAGAKACWKATQRSLPRASPAALLCSQQAVHPFSKSACFSSVSMLAFLPVAFSLDLNWVSSRCQCLLQRRAASVLWLGSECRAEGTLCLGAGKHCLGVSCISKLFQGSFCCCYWEGTSQFAGLIH